MKVNFLDWLDHRTGYRKIVEEALFENIPGGARWRYVWGSTLVFCFVTQVITGFFLWMGYSPSAQTAWESVYYIQQEMAGGWFLRGIHHYTAQIFPVLLVLHLMQVVIDGAYRAPREINFWVGIILAKLILGMALTGYLLPWDQKGYWATKVATNIAGSTPVIGPSLQRLAIGGAEYGHHTLTRFFALHAGILPMAVFMMLGLHIYVFRRHSLTAKEPFKKPDSTFWPDQVLKDSVACLAVLAAILFFVLRNGIGHGAELYAPADPTAAFSAARPDWYFLFLFQILKVVTYVTHDYSILLGAFIIPGLIFAVLMAMPIVGRRELGHKFNIGFVACLLVGITLLTYQAMAKDSGDSTYLEAVVQAQKDAERVKALAHSPMGIPSSGAITLLWTDPLTQGPRLFAKNCASCHRFDGHNGLGQPVEEKASASDLKGFASRSWLKGLLDPEQISTPKYFGGTKFSDGKMAKYVKKNVPKFDDGEKELLAKVIVALSAEAKLKNQRNADARDATIIAEGHGLISEIGCTDCHQYYEPDEDATAPNLAGYGSRKWVIGMINNPEHDGFYGSKNDRMPAFGRDEKLTAEQVGILADWLRADWYEEGEELTEEPKPAQTQQAITQRPVEESEQPKPESEKPKPKIESKQPEKPETASEKVEPIQPPIPLSESPKRTVDFAGQIKPIFESRCLSCHNSEKRKGKFLLETKLVAYKGGDSELPSIVPGKPDESNLVKLISLDEDHDDIMPSKGGPLTKDQIQAIRTWIAEGAHWPDGLELKAVKE
ncbi:MAG: cytochrome b N-terminal domain-containing protein [Planctomycetota bacterium]|nr:cytochrome b N-terminal domain-containing protein [Planctomycetota bacterium]